MREYLISMILLSVICIVIRELLSHSEVSLQINFISGICIFLVALSPLFSSLDKIREIEFDAIFDSVEEEKYEGIFEDYIQNAEIDMIKSEIRSLVTEKFSLDESEVKIYLKYNADTDKKLERVTVSLLGRAAFANSNEIKSYLEGVLDCTVVITVGE